MISDKKVLVKFMITFDSKFLLGTLAHVITVVFALRAIGYGIYNIKEQKNKAGGVFFILLAAALVILPFFDVFV